MVKISLLDNDVTINILTANGNRDVNIILGKYEMKRFSDIIITPNSVVLEGDENLLLAGDVSAVYVKIRSIVDKLADILNDKSVYIKKMDVVPHGAEREILQKLVGIV